MKLRELPRGARLKVQVFVDAERDETETKDATFHHIDGSYSLCTLDAEPDDRERIFHLHADQEMVRVEGPDGEHYELAPEVEA